MSLPAGRRSEYLNFDFCILNFEFSGAIAECVTACLLKNEPTSLFYVAKLNSDWSGAKVKARVNSPFPSILQEQKLSVSAKYLDCRMDKTRSRVI